jgi:hypothetical protein
MGDRVDVSQDFEKLEQVYFAGNHVTSFDPANGTGTLEWTRDLRQPALSFNKVDLNLTSAKSNDFPRRNMMRTRHCPLQFFLSVPVPCACA